MTPRTPETHSLSGVEKFIGGWVGGGGGGENDSSVISLVKESRLLTFS